VARGRHRPRSDAIAGSEALKTQMSFGWQLLRVLGAYLRRRNWAVLSLVHDAAQGSIAIVGMPMPGSNETHGRASKAATPVSAIAARDAT
jgi:hypothetical protein